MYVGACSTVCMELYLDRDHPLRVEGGDVGDRAHCDLRVCVLKRKKYDNRQVNLQTYECLKKKKTRVL